MTPEVVLTHENGRWRARGEGLDLEHEDLGALDALIEAQIAEGETVAVHFDAASLPVWTRQYHSHYFAYRLRPAAERPECPEAPYHWEAARGTDR
jgi:hypothetical protein